jgi:hypothetical protein
MCILCFHALAGYLQTYEILLKEINAHPGSAPVEEDLYQIESVALAGRNLNVACETGSLGFVTLSWLPCSTVNPCCGVLVCATVIFHVMHVYIRMY